MTGWRYGRSAGTSSFGRVPEPGSSANNHVIAEAAGSS
jgi:hypothetical protein